MSNVGIGFSFFAVWPNFAETGHVTAVVVQTCLSGICTVLYSIYVHHIGHNGKVQTVQILIKKNSLKH